MIRKVVLVMVIVLMGVNGYGQNYKAVQMDSERYFINDTGLIRCIRIDSIDVSVNDTILTNFFTLSPGNNSNGWCYDTTAPTWIGLRIILEADGTNIFQNSVGDLIFVHTLAQLNDSFYFYEYPNYDYLEAKVISIDTESFLSTIDSIKTFSLQAKNSSGINIANKFNGLEFKLSQNYGFKQLYNMLNFPNDTTKYTISKYRRLTNQEVFDFDIGDVFNIYDSWSYIGPYQTGTNSYLINILGKFYSSANDTVFYVRHVDYTYTDSQFGSGQQIYNDTINYTNLNSFYSNRLPEQPITDGTYLTFYYLLSKPNKFCGEVYMEFIDSSTLMNSPGCYVSFSSEYPFGITDYAKGFGEVYNYYYLIAVNGGTDDYNLVGYYKANHCSPSAGISLINEKIPNQITLYPNPNSGTFTLNGQLSMVNCQLKIVDISGRVVYTQSISNTSGKEIIDASALNNGMYFWELLSGTGLQIPTSTVAQGKLVLIK
jgi:hypothetical protein